jgi:[ribosomal protein S5]-alanine N-acetyltransferase
VPEAAGRRPGVRRRQATRRRPRAFEVGERVLLRRPTARDRAQFLAFVRAGRRLHHPWVAPPAGPAGFAAYLRRARRRNRLSLLVCRREDGAIVGVVNVSEIVRGALQSAYLGYYGSLAHAGQGYMTEGLALVLRHAFRRLGLHRLEANVQPGNRLSLALVRRLGFRREGFSPRYLMVAGRWRDHQRWAILREEWRDAPPTARRRRRQPCGSGPRGASS